MNYFSILKDTNKEDLKLIKWPLLGLLGFVFLVVFLFPKPVKIYRDYVLKECKCIGFRAVPKMTYGSTIGDEYCMGLPVKCVKQKIVKGVND